jgi:exopolyphosphatase / guanosine-5'-triphosphate,3'-diphosphate pyrophosphatase
MINPYPKQNNMESIRFAAVDIGSNAVRLLIMNVTPSVNPVFTKELMIRIPLRLGKESFGSGSIPEKKRKKLLRVMKAFRHLIKVYDVEDYWACATAAMREAKNSKDIVKEIREKTSLRVEVIDGQEEALIIYDSHFMYHLNVQQNYLFVDVGGGSTEISVISGGEFVRSFSYKLGTLRLLLDKVNEMEWERLRADMEALKAEYQINDIIGSGGNIVKLNSLAKVRSDRKLTVKMLETLNISLKELTVEERMEKLGLKEDRADIITLAADIYLNVAGIVGAKSYIVPKIGLIDGMIYLLFEEWKKKKKKKSSKTEQVEDCSDPIEQVAEVDMNSTIPEQE